MKIRVAAVAFAPVVFAFIATPASAIDMEFTGAISMGLVGTSRGGDTDISPFLGVDAEATLTFEIGDALTVGIVVPLEGEIVDSSFLPASR